MKPAVFLDRDGTMIEQVHHLHRVEDVRVYPFTAEALRRLQDAGFAIVVVTNQSVVGRGLLTLDGLSAIHQEMLNQLGRPQLIDGIYFSTSVPVAADRTVVVEDDPDRKPGPGLLLRAAQDLGLDLKNSWMVGDMVSDLLAGKNAGCRGSILVRTGYGEETLAKGHSADFIVDTLLDAVNVVVEKT